MPVVIDAVWTNGGGDGLWTTAANWSPANVPTAAEDVRIPAGTASINCTGMSDVAHGELHIERGYTGTIGASGARLASSFTKVIHEGSDKLWFGGGAGATALIVVAAPNAGVDALDAQGSITAIVAHRGRITTTASAATLARLEIGYVSNPDGDVHCTLGSSSNAITKLVQRGGYITSERLITLLEQKGGYLLQRVGQAITEADIYGTVNYQSLSTATTLRVEERGYLDLQTGRTGAVTVTTMNVAPGGKYKFNPSLVTFANDVNDWNRFLDA